MISLLCPTRKRPDNFARFAKSARETAVGPIEIIAYQDEDDDSPIQPDILVRGPRIVMSQMWNECAEKATGDLLMLCGDDLVFKTPGWDRMIKGAFAGCPDKILYVHGDDCSPNAKNFGTHGTIHRRWMETVGSFTMGCFVADFADRWQNDMAVALGRRLYLPYVTEHLHWVFSKAALDETYNENRERYAAHDPHKLYWDKEPERLAQIEKLSAAMDPGWKLP
jgi:hypothetical protein